MRRYAFPRLVFLVLLGSLIVPMHVARTSARVVTCVSSSGTKTLHGALDGAYYTIAVPRNWNGTLVLYSHGYAFPGTSLNTQAADAPNIQIGAALLQNGYALAGSSYSQDGWAIQQAFHDQIALLNYFSSTCGQPARTIAWGNSMGGLVTAALAQLYPDRFTAALPMCGLLAGGIGQFNVMLDNMFAFNALLADNTLQLVHISNPTADLNQAETVLSTAQQTPQGRARIALSVALEDMPGELAGQNLDPVTQEQNQFIADEQIMNFNFAARAEIETRAGGNPSWTTGVDFRQQLQESVDYPEVVALYKQAGLDLNKDLARLNTLPRISADPQAVTYATRYFDFDGNIGIPVLSLHSVGDQLAYVQEEQAYASVVHAAGDSSLLRQVFVNHAGHCAFTNTEVLTAFSMLIQRVDLGFWGNVTDPALLNDQARKLGSTFSSDSPAFLSYQSAAFLRPFDARERKVSLP